MEEEEEEIKRKINNITCDTSLQSSVAINVHNKDTNLSLERQLASGVLAEIVEYFKECTIQSTISNSAHSDSDKHVYKINDYE